MKANEIIGANLSRRVRDIAVIIVLASASVTLSAQTYTPAPKAAQAEAMDAARQSSMISSLALASAQMDQQNRSLTRRAPAPQIAEAPRKGFSGMITVKLIEPDLRCTVYYTTDGSDPSINGQTYNGPFTVPRGTRVRTVAKWPGHLSSYVISHTFR